MRRVYNRFRKKGNGFSLMELLAVIVIIAILAMITIPFISNIIRAARIKSAVVSAYGYVEATNNEIVSRGTRGENVIEKKYIIENFNVEQDEIVVRYEGRGPVTGWFNVDRSKVHDGEFCINGFDIKYENGVATYVKDGTVCPTDIPDNEPDPPELPEPPTFVRYLCEPNEEGVILEYDASKDYSVDKINDLVCLSKIVREGNTFANAYVKMISDIDFNNEDDYVNLEDTTLYGDFNQNGTVENIKNEVSNRTGTKAYGFYPIGDTNTIKFAGDFDGDGHSISNLYMKRTGIGMVSLFSSLDENGVVENLTMNDVYVNGYYTFSAIVGYNYGLIENVNVNTATLIGSNNSIGGVVGYMYDGSSVIGANVNNVIINGHNSLGGIAGGGKNCTITGVNVIGATIRSYTGSQKKFVGGVIGYGEYLNITEAAVYGSLEGNTFIGGAVGSYYKSETTNVVRNVYVNATLKANTGKAAAFFGANSGNGRVIGVMDGVSINASTNYGIVGTSGTSSNSAAYISSSVTHTGTEYSTTYTTYNNDYNGSLDYFSRLVYDETYPVLETKDTDDVNNSGFWFDYDIEGRIVVVKAEKQKTIIIKKKINNICDGTEFFNPSTNYSVEDVEDLVCLSEKVAAGIDFEGTNIYFINDIDFNNNNSYSKGNTKTYKDYNGNGIVEGIKKEMTTGAGFPVIGSSSKPFKGNIYGQGYTISNLRIINDTDNNVGLFGYIASEGNVGGFYLSAATVRGNDNVGAIAANVDGTITSVKILNSSINGMNNVGGIAGIGTGTIKESEVRSTITATGEYAGGVIGYLPTTKDSAVMNINGVLVNSTITASDYAGGVSGTGYANNMYAIIDGGTITGSSGKATTISYNGGYKTDGVLYANSSVTISGSGVYNEAKPNIYNYDRQFIAMFDDVLDTWIGGDNDDSEFYFDFESDNSNNVILKHVEDDTFKIHLKGRGISSNPYQLKNEKDFKEATLLLTRGYNFKVMNDVNLSNFKHFYGIGTYNNYFSGELDGNNKTISNLNMYGGRYAGFVGYANNATISNFKFSNSYIAPIYNATSKSVVGISIGEANNSNISNIELNNSTINGTSSFAGIFAGEATGTINGVKVRDISLNAYDGVGSLIGHFGQNSSAINVDISIPNYNLVAHNYVGGIGGLVESPIKYSTINLDNVKVKGYYYVGGMFGKVDNGTAGYAIVNNIEIEGHSYIGGGAGIVGENGTLQSLGLFNLNIHGSDISGMLLDPTTVPYYDDIDIVGGAVGENHGTVNEIYTSGTIIESTYSGALVGKNIGTTAKAIGSVTNMNLINCYNCGGYIGYNDADATFNGVVDGGKIELNNDGIMIGGTSRVTYSAVGNYDIGNQTYYEFLRNKDSEYYNIGYVYISDSFTKTTSNDSTNVFKKTEGLDGYQFKKSKHFFALYDDVVDTWFGGDNDDSGFYFDFENDNSDSVILKQVNAHSFDVTLSGAGTQSNPYLLSTEKDFRDAALYLRRGYYFKLANDIDVSTFKHFYNLGTYGNYFNGYLNGDNKTIDNMIIEGGKYTGFSNYQNGGKIENLNFNHSVITTAKYDVNHYTDCTGGDGCIYTTLGVVLGYGKNAVDTNIRISNATINDIVSDNVGIFSGSFLGSSGKASKIFVDNSTASVDADIGGIIGVIDESTLQTASFERTNYIKTTDRKSAAGIVVVNAGTVDETYAGGKIEGGTASGIAFYLYIAYRSGEYGEILSSVVDAEIIGKYDGDGFFNQGFAWSGSPVVRGVITPRTTITADNSAEVSTLKKFTGSDRNIVYVSESTSVTNLHTYEYQEKYKDHGAIYKDNYHTIGMFDDVLDTPYAGDNNNTGYYFDFENDNSDNIVLKSLAEYPLTITLSGEGTEASPYILATEKDFKDAAVLCKGNKYFTISNNIDISTFNHFYQLGTYNNYFNGIVNGNNNTLSNMHLHGGRYAGLIGYLYGGQANNIKLVNSDVIDLYGQDADVGAVIGYASGNTSNLYADNVTVDSSRGGSYAGAFAGNIGSGNHNGLELTNNFSITGNQHVGGFAGSISGTLQNIKVDLHNKTISGTKYVGGFAGSISGSISFNTSNLNNITVTSTEDYVGGFAGSIRGTISNITISNPIVTGKDYAGGFAGGVFGSTSDLTYVSHITVNNPTVTTTYSYGARAGGFAGQTGTSSTSYVSNEGTTYNLTAVITDINVNGGTVTGSGSTSYASGALGGLSGINYATLRASNVDGTTISTSGSESLGGISGSSMGYITEVSSKVTISSSGNNSNCGGIVGAIGYNSIKNAFTKSNITCNSVSGVAGSSSMNDTLKAKFPIYAVVESGTLTGTSAANKAAGFAYTGEIHVSNSVTSNMDGTYNGIGYASTLDKNLSYYGNLTYDVVSNDETTTYPILDSAYTGDVNASGYWFKLIDNNDIKVVPVEENYLCPDGINTPPCPGPTIQTVVDEDQVCTTGDTEPPECTLHSVVPVIGGLRANFSCTDNAGAPLMASMFNATTSAAYSYDEILAPNRGSQKTGTVNGNTRSWVGSWTKTGDPDNPPQDGLCYYYQFAAKDDCGNSKAWVSTSCYSFYDN